MLSQKFLFVVCYTVSKELDAFSSDIILYGMLCSDEYLRRYQNYGTYRNARLFEIQKRLSQNQHTKFYAILRKDCFRLDYSIYESYF